jgi:hypothetical protein
MQKFWATLENFGRTSPMLANFGRFPKGRPQRSMLCRRLIALPPKASFGSAAAAAAAAASAGNQNSLYLFKHRGVKRGRFLSVIGDWARRSRQASSERSFPVCD